jgi:hypothetical protein
MRGIEGLVKCLWQGYQAKGTGRLSLGLQAHVVEQAVLEVHEEARAHGRKERERDGKVHLLHEERHNKAQQVQAQEDKTKDGNDVEPDAVLGRHGTKQVII